MFVRLFLAVVLLALPVAPTFAGAPTALLLPKDADRLWHTPLGFRYQANVVSQVAFSPDGATLAAVSSDFTNHAIRLFDLVNQREIIRFGEDGRGYYDMLFSHDGTLLYATGSNGDFPREHEPCPIGSDRALDSALITAPAARDKALLKKLDAVAGRVLRK